jgi:CRISPR-associated protein (TIGR02710 family)
MKKKAMLMTVGVGQGTENGIVVSIKDSMPEYITFILTEKSRETYKKVMDKLGEEYFDEKKIILIQGGEEENFQSIYLKIIDCIDEYIKKGIERENIFIDITFGTKAMTAGIITAGIYKKISHIKYISGERDIRAGRVKSGTEKVISTTPTEIFNNYHYDDFKKLFNKFQFDASQKAIDNISDNFFYDNYLGDFREAYDFLISSYSLWDRFNYEKALGELNKAKEKIKLIKDLDYEKYRNNFSFLEKLCDEKKKTKYPRELVVDIFLNAKRRDNEGKFDDALIRLYRVMELISQNVLYYKYKIDPADIKENQLKILPSEITTKIEYKQGKKTTSGMTDNYEILKHLNNELGINYCQDSSIRDIMGIRNYSILIHGENPINKNNLSRLMGIVEKFLCTFFSLKENLDKQLSNAKMANFN